ALGLTLGAIGFVRGYLTPSDTRSGPRKVDEPFSARAPAGQRLESAQVSEGYLWWEKELTEYTLPKDTTLTRTSEQEQRVRVPHGTAVPEPVREGHSFVYLFPPNCEVRTPPVGRWELAQVVALSVLGICLWGTLIGAILPLIFRWLSVDPALASSP